MDEWICWKIQAREALNAIVSVFMSAIGGMESS